MWQAIVALLVGAFAQNVTDYGPCSYDGEAGRCMDYRQCTRETTTANLCPGPDNIQCCVPRVGLIDVPIACQLPQLKNGCEVTSLSMLLGWAGVHVDKMTLAAQVAKVFNTVNLTAVNHSRIPLLTISSTE
jgi:hypothetical protein